MPVVHRKSGVRWGRATVVRRPDSEYAYMPDPVMIGVGLDVYDAEIDMQTASGEIGILETMTK